MLVCPKTVIAIVHFEARSLDAHLEVRFADFLVVLQLFGTLSMQTCM